MEYRLYTHEHHYHTNKFLKQIFYVTVHKKAGLPIPRMATSSQNSETKSQRQDLKTVAREQNSQNLFPGQKSQSARIYVFSEVSSPIIKEQKYTAYSNLSKQNIS